jgi:hypothetical protein
VYLYSDALPHFLATEDLPYEYYPCVIPGWDNTPRCGVKGHALHDATPELFQLHVKAAVKRVAHLPLERRMVFVKSWNEWAEGNYLGPDRQFGKSFLRVVRDECYQRKPAAILTMVH